MSINLSKYKKNVTSDISFCLAEGHGPIQHFLWICVLRKTAPQGHITKEGSSTFPQGCVFLTRELCIVVFQNICVYIYTRVHKLTHCEMYTSPYETNTFSTSL